MKTSQRLKNILDKFEEEIKGKRKFSLNNGHKSGGLYFFLEPEWKYIGEIINILGDDYKRSLKGSIEFIVMPGESTGNMSCCEKFIQKMDEWGPKYDNLLKREKIMTILSELKKWKYERKEDI